jgi:hypothetical protein
MGANLMKALFVAWRPAASDTGWRPIGRLEHDGQLYRFCYTVGARKPGFRPFEQMEDLDQIYESDELVPLFANRLLSKSRPEYEAYLRWGGFEITEAPDPIMILGVTEGRRQTDSVEVFPCPQIDSRGNSSTRFFLHGIQWIPDSALDRILRMHPGDRLMLMLDLQNPHDRHAVAVRTESDCTLIGYLPRYLARDLWRLSMAGEEPLVQLVVDRVNFDAPMQSRVLCRLTAVWPEGFQLCQDEDFEPINLRVSRLSVG